MTEKIYIYTLDNEELLYSVGVPYPPAYRDIIDNNPRLPDIRRTVIIDGDPVRYERFGSGIWIRA